MVNLFPELSGSGAGALGSGLGGLLGQLGGLLSAPRKMLWSALGGPESGSELVHNLLGVDPESFAGQALGMGAEMLGDPLAWAGGPLTRALGGTVGKSASKAQLLKGPEYAGDAAKLSGLADAASTAAAAKGMPTHTPLHELLAGESPANLGRLASEIPEGTSFLGSGAEGAALKTPQGGVIRIQFGGQTAPASRVAAPEMLAPHRNVTAGGTRLEHLPMVNTEASAVAPLEGEYNLLRSTPRTPETAARARALVDQMENQGVAWKGRGKPLADSASGRGLLPNDLNNPENIALTSEGRLLTHDPGAILPGDLPAELVPSTNLGDQPGRIGSALSRLLGGRGRLRDYLGKGYASGGAGQGILY